MNKLRSPWSIPKLLLYYSVPVLIAISVWVPELQHYHVTDVAVTDEIINRARATPGKDILDELSGYSIGAGPKLPADDPRLLPIAEKLMQGRVELPGYPSIQVHIPFHQSDLEVGSGHWQLAFSALAIPKVLLTAYQATGREELLLRARDIIVAWSEYERSAWVPKGFLWNDHAIAGRTMVLSDFWRLYRNHPTYDPEIAKQLFDLVTMDRDFLAKPSHFTVSTNHGIMQNLALFQLCLSFPTLPDTDRYKSIAMTRMADQMEFFINKEGVVLEHSAGYHEFGTDLVAQVLRYLQLLKLDPPDGWVDKYLKAVAFHSQLRRPDGSLPVFGDTLPGPRNQASFLSERLKLGGTAAPETFGRQSDALYPVAGYSIWWDQAPVSRATLLSQTVVAWSRFLGHGHKHADEMSVILWCGGQTWWTNIGYWPYEHKDRTEAQSWDGSNAPHLRGEPQSSSRLTRIVSYSQSETLKVIDLERTGPGTFLARRQVLHVGRPPLWLVIDHTSGGADQTTTTTWTTVNNVLIQQKSSDSYELTSDSTNVRLAAFFLGPSGMRVDHFRGAPSPFAGWEATNDGIKSVSAIRIEQPAQDSWAVVAWTLSDNQNTRDSPLQPRVDWQDVENWRITIPGGSGETEVLRAGRQIRASGLSGAPLSLVTSELLPPPPIPEFEQVRAGYEHAARKYPTYRYLLPYRTRATYYLIVLFVFQEILFGISRRALSRAYGTLRVVAAIGWFGLGIWLFFVYFRV